VSMLDGDQPGGGVVPCPCACHALGDPGCLEDCCAAAQARAELEPEIAATRAQLDRAGTVVEAARQYLAAHLRWEHAAGNPDLQGERQMYRDDALQTLRDAAAAERRARPRSAA
jgi:hypothetical protein